MLTDVYKVVSHRDPAIDREAMGPDFEKYKMKYDYDLLKFVTGVEPMVFTLREIPQGLMIRVVLAELSGNDEPGPREWSFAFACAVTSVKNVRQRGGVMMPDENAIEARYPNGILKDEALERFELKTILEIGAVALQRSFLALTTDEPLQLPRMCRG